jgi:hypothetical protein
MTAATVESVGGIPPTFEDQLALLVSTTKEDDDAILEALDHYVVLIEQRRDRQLNLLTSIQTQIPTVPAP